MDSLLDKFSELHERQVIVLESPMNEATCALESFAEVPFQVHYATASFGRKLPIILWETHLIDDQERDCVHYHTIVDDTLNVNQALMEAGLFEHFDLYDYKTVEMFVLSKYDYEYLP